MKKHNQKERNRKRVKPIKKLKIAMISHKREWKDNNNRQKKELNDTSWKTKRNTPCKNRLPIVKTFLLAHKKQIHKMSNRVYDRLNHDYNAYNFMYLYEIVYGHDWRPAFSSQPCEMFTQDQYQNKCTIKI